MADSDNNRVQELSSSGAFLSKFGTKGTGNGQFEFPQAIDIKESGALLVVDRWTGRVQEFTPQAEYLAQFGGEQLIEPRGLATGPQGAVYVTNTYKDRVERWQEPIPEAITQAVSTQRKRLSTGPSTREGSRQPTASNTAPRSPTGLVLQFLAKALAQVWNHWRRARLSRV